jgi:hypothetical protein
LAALGRLSAVTLSVIALEAFDLMGDLRLGEAALVEMMGS